MDSQPLFSRDLTAIQRMKPRELVVISNLLAKKRPSRAEVESSAPLSFLYMFYLNYRLRTDSDVDPEVKKTLEPLAIWFDRHFPSLESKAGFAVFKNISQESMREFDVDLSGRAHQRNQAAHKTISHYRAEPCLAGKNMLPSIRVFFKHGETLLLDSTGDWDDWLYVVKCLSESLADQAASVSRLKAAQRVIPWNKVETHLRGTKKALRSFEKEISSYKPQAKAKKKTKKSKA